MKIAAVVYTYNRKNLLEECLNALLKQNYHIDEIIVVDDASTDGTEKLLQQKFSDLTYFKLKENSGGAGSIKAGMELAYKKRYDWIWILDDDALPAPNALEEIVKIINTGKIPFDNLGAFVSRRVWPIKKLDISIPREKVEIIKNTEFAGFPLGSRKLENSNLPKNIESVNSFCFSGLLVFRKAIESVGFPIKEFFIFWDDVEYSQRLINKGFNLYQVLNSYVLHPLWKPHKIKKIFGRIIGLEDYQDWRSYYVTRNEILMYKFQQRKDFIFCVLRWLVRAVIIEIMFRFFANDKGKIKFIFKGAVDGLLGKTGKMKI